MASENFVKEEVVVKKAPGARILIPEETKKEKVNRIVDEGSPNMSKVPLLLDRELMFKKRTS